MAIGSVFGPIGNVNNDQIVQPQDPSHWWDRLGDIVGGWVKGPPVTQQQQSSATNIYNWLNEPGVTRSVQEWGTGVVRDISGQGGPLDNIFGNLDYITGGDIFSDYRKALNQRSTAANERLTTPEPSTTPVGVPSYTPPSVPTFPDFNTLGMQLEANRAKLAEARAAAIRKSGSSAAAPYDRAIAALDQEIAKMREASVQKDTLFQGISDRTSGWYDKAIEAAKPLAVDAAASQRIIRGKVLEEQGKIFSSINAKMSDRFRAINGGQEVASVAAAGLQEIQDQIYADTEARHISMENIARATGSVMEASARLARATNRTELERQRLMIQFQIDEEVDNMLEQRKDLVARRAAAVAAARQAAMNAYGDITPAGQFGYAFAHVQQYVFNMFQGRDQTERDAFLQELGGVLSGQQGLVTGPGGEVTSEIKTLKDARYYLASLQESIVSNGGSPFSPEDFDFFTKIIFESSVIYRQGIDIWNTEVSVSDPSIYKPGSLDRYNALYAEITNNNPLISPDEADTYARDPRNHQTYTPTPTGRGAGEQTQPGYGVRAG